MLPVFLVGALGESIRADLGLSETAVGALVTTVFASAAVVATGAGRLVERVGSGVALRTGVVVAGLGAAAVGALARGWWPLLVPMVVVGSGVALIDTGAARAFADRVPVARQGLAFGIKEASIPAASMLAGLALPTVAALLGWRASFLAAACVAAVVAAWLPSPRALLADVPDSAVVPGAAGGAVVEGAPVGGDAVGGAAVGGAAVGGAATARAPAPGRVATPAVVRFAAGVGLGTGAATAGATFLVPSVVAQGVSPSVAGIVLAAASLASIVARVGVGRWADTEAAAPVPVVVRMLALGGLGAGLLAVDPPMVLVVAAAIVVLGAGWGWTGLAFLAVVRANPLAPAAAAGVVLTGLGLGGALGPLAFGALVDRRSYAVAWSVAAGALLVGATLARSARRELAPGIVPDHATAPR